MYITLPLPPSLNSAYRNIVVKGKSRTLLSKDGRMYKEDVKKRLVGMKTLGDSRLEVSYIYYFQTKRKSDIANREKLLSDALQGMVFDDDEQIDVLHQRRGGVDRINPRVEIHIKAIRQQMRIVYVPINEDGRLVGEGSPACKYSDRFVEMVQSLHDSGRYGYKLLAKELKVPVSSVRDWCSGMTRCQVAVRSKRVKVCR